MDPQEQRDSVPPTKEELLGMTLRQWADNYAKRHRMSHFNKMGIKQTLIDVFERAVPVSSKQKILMHPKLYAWLRDESIAKLGRKIGSANPPIGGITRVRDLRDVFIMAPIYSKDSAPWTWLFATRNDKKAMEKTIKNIESMLREDGLL